MNNIERQLNECELFQHLRPDELARLSASSTSHRFERGRTIFAARDQCDSVYVLSAGRVRTFHILPDGKQILLAFIERGELFGELAVVGAVGHGEAVELRKDFAETMEASRLVVMPQRVLSALVDRDLELAKKFVGLIGRRRIGCERRLKSLLFRSSCDRLVLLLLELKERYGQVERRGARINIRLSHQDLASAIGSARETVTNLLGQLRGAGLIEIDRRQIVITEPDRLAAIPAGALQDWPDR